MSDFTIRLFEEQEQLNERRNKLDNFLITEDFKQLHPVQKTLLEMQSLAMKSYSLILAERVKWIVAGEVKN